MEQWVLDREWDYPRPARVVDWRCTRSNCSTCRRVASFRVPLHQLVHELLELVGDMSRTLHAKEEKIKQLRRQRGPNRGLRNPA